MVWHHPAWRPVCECALEFILAAGGVSCRHLMASTEEASSSETVWLPGTDGIPWILSFPLAYWDDEGGERLQGETGPGIRGR